MGQCMERIKKELIISSRVPVTYAGRLDPMADGLVIFLVGEMRFYKDKFLKLSKTYQVSFFLGFNTDTYDILGIAEKQKTIAGCDFDTVKNVSEALYPIDVPKEQKFPQFSSRKFNGKPLFVFAKNNTSIPQISHDVTLYDLDNFSSQQIHRDVLFQKIIQDIDLVVGDFRQESCKQSWCEAQNQFPKYLNLYSLDLSVSSGFYVRSWVHELGRETGCGAVTFSITRSIIGVFTMSMVDSQQGYAIFEKDNPIITQLLLD